MCEKLQRGGGMTNSSFKCQFFEEDIPLFLAVSPGMFHLFEPFRSWHRMVQPIANSWIKIDRFSSCKKGDPSWWLENVLLISVILQRGDEVSGMTFGSVGPTWSKDSDEGGVIGELGSDRPSLAGGSINVGWFIETCDTTDDLRCSLSSPREFMA